MKIWDWIHMKFHQGSTRVSAFGESFLAQKTAWASLLKEVQVCDIISSL